MTQQALADVVNNGGAYVRFKDVNADTIMTEAVAKLVDIASIPWLWVAVGTATLYALTLG